MLNSGLAIWFSEDGLQISYATFNDSKVEELKYPWFGTLDEGKLYPDTRTLRYPKVKTPLLDFIYRTFPFSLRALSCGVSQREVTRVCTFPKPHL